MHAITQTRILYRYKREDGGALSCGVAVSYCWGLAWHVRSVRALDLGSRT